MAVIRLDPELAWVMIVAPLTQETLLLKVSLLKIALDLVGSLFRFKETIKVL